MKTLKFKTFFIALLSVVTFSSCLGESETTDYPNYSSFVTISGDAFFGYTFHSDFGCTLQPTQESINQVLPGLKNSSAKRALISFDLIPESENGKELKAGETYTIALKAAYGSNIALPTYSTIDTYGNQTAADSLTAKNGSISNIKSQIWAINGYANAEMTIVYDYNKPFYMNTYYDYNKDIDIEGKTLYLNIYYNKNSTSATQPGSSVFSFSLPQSAANQFLMNGFAKEDSINLVMKAITDYDLQLKEVGKCKMAIKDFYQPTSF